MTRKPVVLERKDWAAEANRWVGRVEGKDIGTNVTILFFSSDRIGSGPPLHVQTVPIRLTQTPTTSRMRPLARIELGIGWRFGRSSDPEQ